MPTIQPYQTSAELTVPQGQKIAIASEGKAKVFYSSFPNEPVVYSDSPDQQLNNGSLLLGTFTYDKKLKIESKGQPVYYGIGTAAEVLLTEIAGTTAPGFARDGGLTGDFPRAFRHTRNTISDTGTVTGAQHRSQVLYQDASGGNVTMTSATATNLNTAFPNMAIGDSVMQFMSSNHASNTSTISGGSGVTLVGSGAVTNTGGLFLLIKTAASTYDLVRVG